MHVMHGAAGDDDEQATNTYESVLHRRCRSDTPAGRHLVLYSLVLAEPAGVKPQSLLQCKDYEY